MIAQLVGGGGGLFASKQQAGGMAAFALGPPRKTMLSISMPSAVQALPVPRVAATVLTVLSSYQLRSQVRSGKCLAARQMGPDWLSEYSSPVTRLSPFSPAPFGAFVQCLPVSSASACARMSA
jgi:hypothetical protein